MTTQTGLIVNERGFLELRHDLGRPTPGPKQALVKSLYIGISQLDLNMTSAAVPPDGLPSIAGSNYGGVVLETGLGCEKLRAGDYVFGMCMLRCNSYSPFQQTFLVDENLDFKKPEQLSTPITTTFGISILVAALGVVIGGHIEMPRWPAPPPKRDEWVVILGCEGLIGTFAIQIARLCGYSVVVACPLTKVSDALRAGATETFDNRSPPEKQLSHLKNLIGRARIRLIFDATATPKDTPLRVFYKGHVDVNSDPKDNKLRVPESRLTNESNFGSPSTSTSTSTCTSPTTELGYYEPTSPSCPKKVEFDGSFARSTYFSAVDMGTSHKVRDVLATLPSPNTYIVRADLIGSSDEQGIKLKADVAKLISILETHIDKRCIAPGPCDMFNKSGWEAMIHAITLYQQYPPKSNVAIQVQRDV